MTLSLVLHTAVHLINDPSSRVHIAPRLQQLCWLPICAHITFKIFLLMYHIHSGSSPSYMSAMVMPCSASNHRAAVLPPVVCGRAVRRPRRAAAADNL